MLRSYLKKEYDKCNKQARKLNYKNKIKSNAIFQRVCGIELAIRGLTNIIDGPTFLLRGLNESDFQEEKKERTVVEEKKINNKLLKKIKSIKGQLANRKFLDNAPKDIVEKKQEKLKRLEKQL